jgi:hypothetical protein
VGGEVVGLRGREGRVVLAKKDCGFLLKASLLLPLPLPGRGVVRQEERRGEEAEEEEKGGEVGEKILFKANAVEEMKKEEEEEVRHATETG